MLRKSRIHYLSQRLSANQRYRIKNLEGELEQMQGSVQRSHGRR